MARQLGTDPDTLTARLAHGDPCQSTAVVADELPSITSEAQSVIDRTPAAAATTSARASARTASQIAFFSERDRFSVELFIADADTGKIPKQALAVGDRPPLRQPRVPELRRRLESRRRGLRRSPLCAAAGPSSRFSIRKSGRILRELKLAGPRRCPQSGVRAGRPLDRLQRQSRRADRSLSRARSRRGRSTG